MYTSKNLLLLFLLFASNRSLAQWSRCEKDSTIVTYSHLESNAMQVVPDAGGGAYYVWYEGNPNVGQFRAHAQHLNKEGIRLWGDTGIPVAPESGNQVTVQCLSDGMGGLLIFWIESRLGNGLNDLFGQHLTASGQSLWGAGGRYISDCFDFYRYPIIRLSDGMLATVFNVEQAGGQYFSTFLRKLEPDGALAYDVLLEEKHQTNYPTRLLPDNQGGVFAVWQNDTIKVQYLDEAGDTWVSPISVLPDDTGSGSVPAAFACTAGPDGIFLAWCGKNAQTQFCDLMVQRYDNTGQTGLSLPHVTIPIFGFDIDQMFAAQDGGFYFFALNALFKVNASGALQWRSEIPGNTNTGLFSFYIETEKSMVLAAYSANGMVFFDASGTILWQHPGNPINGGALGMAGICRTTDESFITAQIDPFSSSPLLVTTRKLDDSGYQVNSLREFGGMIAGPDSVQFNSPFLLEAQPIDGIILDWFYSFAPALGFEKVPDDALGANKKTLGVGGIYYDLYSYATVQLGRNCRDTTALDTVHVRPVLSEGDFTKADDPIVIQPTVVGMELFVASTFEKPYLVEFWVTDMSGRVVDFLEFKVDSGNFYGLYPTDSLAHGIYFFNLKVLGKAKFQKFIKIKH